MVQINTITAANSVYLLAIINLFDSPQQLQGFAADAAFAGDARTPAETIMGVDGNMSVGFTFSLYKQKISIMPDSPSYTIFEEWLSAMEAAQEIYIANATILLPSIGRSYDLTKGVLTSSKPIPDVKKVLQPSEFEITWGKVRGSNV